MTSLLIIVMKSEQISEGAQIFSDAIVTPYQLDFMFLGLFVSKYDQGGWSKKINKVIISHKNLIK